MNRSYAHKANNALGAAIILLMALAATFEVGQDSQVAASEYIRLGLLIGIVISGALNIWYRRKAGEEKP